MVEQHAPERRRCERRAALPLPGVGVQRPSWHRLLPSIIAASLWRKHARGDSFLVGGRHPTQTRSSLCGRHKRIALGASPDGRSRTLPPARLDAERTLGPHSVVSRPAWLPTQTISPPGSGPSSALRWTRPPGPGSSVPGRLGTWPGHRSWTAALSTVRCDWTS